MAKKKSWLYRLKRLFISETHSRLDSDKRRRRICGFGMFFAKRRLAALSAPSPLADCRLLSEAENEPAPTAAGSDLSVHQFEEANKKIVSKDHVNAHMINLHSGLCAKEVQMLAAIRIQTAFRGYIARKALRALKGLVKLQAIIRGHVVRRQAITTLKCLQTIVNIQSEVCAKRCELVKTTSNCQENKLADLGEKDIKIDLNSQRRWDDSPRSKEEANFLTISKREAEIKRERIKEYWSNHRRSAETDQSRIAARRRYWLEQWVDGQLAKRDDFRNLDAVTVSAKARIRDQLQSRQHKLRKLQKDYDTDGFETPVYVPRRSFHRKQHSTGDDTSFAESPAIPTYMAATESARAKTRSFSSPRLRPINIDAYSEINSPYKHRLSPISSINSEATSIGRIVYPTGLSQRAPCLKGVPGPIKSKRSLRDLSLNPDMPAPTWDRHGSSRLYS